jgi:hypothetical protein
MFDGSQDLVDCIVVEAGVAGDADPVGLVLERVLGQEVALLAVETEDAGHVGAEFCDVTTSETFAVEIPVTPNIFTSS